MFYKTITNFSKYCSEEIVVVVATAIAILDVIFIMVCVPESLPDKCRPIASTRGLTFDQVTSIENIGTVGGEWYTIFWPCLK